MATCKITDCAGKHYCRGWCQFHYNRWRHHGDPFAGGSLRIVGDDYTRFWSKVEERASDCWEWTGKRHANGYGLFSADGRWGQAHRWAYQCVVGVIPDGLQIDHLCRSHACVNPAHLEAVTNRENGRRGTAAEVNRLRQLSLTHCKHGHPLSGENVHVAVTSTGTRRVCRACARDKAARYHRRKKAAA